MKFENTWVGNFEGALRGMRNPKNSWAKSDSYFGVEDSSWLSDKAKEVIQTWIHLKYPEYVSNNDWRLCKEKILNIGNLSHTNSDWDIYALIGPNDMELAQRLIKSGPEHRKFLRQIFVSVDITGPMYFWSEMDTYKVATVANSTSKMHKLAETPITLDCFEIDDFNKDLRYYTTNTTEMLSEIIIEQLEYLRLKYLETKDKKYWKELIRWLPESWLQKRTWSANYETIRAICSPSQRRNHKLSEWSGKENSFISWARTLPYAQYFIFDDENISLLDNI